MQRLRSTWMALMAGALLVTLSVSAAFGAAPTAEEGNRGQSIASFVHELVFGNDETEEDADEELVEEEDELVEDDELADEDESELDEELDDELDEELDEEADEEAANAHGQCVAEEASDKSDEVDEDRNHGAVVSEAARETCWETDESDEDPEELIEEDDEELVDEEEDEEADSHGACVSAAAQDRDGSAESELKNHGKWVSQHARYTCWGLDVPTEDADDTEDEETSELDAASEEADDDGTKPKKAERGNGKPSWAGNGGNGNGRGGGRR